MRSRLLTSLLITGAVVTNIASCRDFDLNDGGADRADTSNGGAPSGDTPSGDTSGGDTSGGDTSGGDTSGGDTSGGGIAAIGGDPVERSHGGNGGQVGGSGDKQAGGGDPAEGGTGAVTPKADAGAGVGGERAEAAASPTALNGLALWLESSDKSFETIGSRVSKWKDSSGNGNDASEASPAFRPLLVPEALHGRAAVEFDGTPSNLTVLDHTTLQFGTEPFTIALVCEFRNSETPQYTQTDNLLYFTYSGYGELLVKVSAMAPYDGIAIFANYPTPYNTAPAQRRLGAQLEFGTAALTSAALDVNDGEFRLFVVQRSAPGMLQQRINGTAQGNLEISASIDVSARGQNLRFGGSAPVPLHGSVAELVMVKGALNESDLLGLERYLMQKFGL